MSKPDIASMAEGEFLCHCPFCARPLHVIRNDVGEAIGLIHALPSCPKYVKLDPDQFIVEVRQRLDGN